MGLYIPLHALAYVALSHGIEQAVGAFHINAKKLIAKRYALGRVSIED